MFYKIPNYGAFIDGIFQHTLTDKIVRAIFNDSLNTLWDYFKTVWMVIENNVSLFEKYFRKLQKLDYYKNQNITEYFW